MKANNLETLQPVIKTPDALVAAIVRGAKSLHWQPGHTLSSEKPIQSYHPKHPKTISCVAVLTDNQFITASQDGLIQVWSLDSTNPLISYKKHHHTISAVDSCGNYVASADISGEVHIWDPSKGKQKTSFFVNQKKEKNDPVRLLANKNKKFATLSNNSGLRFWSYKKKKTTLTKQVDLDFTVVDAQKNSNGSKIVIAGHESILLYNLDSADQIRQFTIEAKIKLQSCVFFQNQSLLLYGKADKDQYELLNIENGSHQSHRVRYQVEPESTLVEIPVKAIPLSHYHVALLTTNNCQILDVNHNKVVHIVQQKPENITLFDDGHMLFHNHHSKALQLFSKTTIEIDLANNPLSADIIHAQHTDHSLRIVSDTNDDLAPTQALLKQLFASRNYLFSHANKSILISNIPSQEMKSVESTLSALKK